ncbi:hypothetical protein [Streptomyces acidicola]|uniref:hypothetical protein n=1 Tax=Streptomyces acidicola TaxID=2596892 RepID=UPI0037FDFEF0
MGRTKRMSCATPPASPPVWRSTTGATARAGTVGIPLLLQEGCTEAERDAAREYARRERQAREDPKR